MMRFSKYLIFSKYSADPEVSLENNSIKQQAFDFARSQYIQHSRKVVMPAGMPTSSHKDVKF
jgi:hypothetical protein